MRSRPEWEATIRTLWDGATHREQWYAALALARHRYYRAWRDPDALPLYRHLIETGAWWDVVDDVATHLLREVREAEPHVVGEQLRQWAHEPSLWLRRAAILAQVGSKARTEPVLLADASSRTSPTPTSSSARPSDGRCVTMPRPTPPGSARSSAGIRTCPACPGGRRCAPT